MQPRKGGPTLGGTLEVIAAHKNCVSFADVGQSFHIDELVIQTTINRSPSLTQSERKSGTRDYP